MIQFKKKSKFGGQYTLFLKTNQETSIWLNFTSIRLRFTLYEIPLAHVPFSRRDELRNLPKHISSR